MARDTAGKTSRFSAVKKATPSGTLDMVGLGAPEAEARSKSEIARCRKNEAKHGRWMKHNSLRPCLILLFVLVLSAQALLSSVGGRGSIRRERLLQRQTQSRPCEGKKKKKKKGFDSRRVPYSLI